MARRILWKSLVVVLIVLLMSGTPAQARPAAGTMKIIGWAATAVGCVINIFFPDLRPIGDALISLQGLLMKTGALVATDPGLEDLTSPPLSFLGSSNTQFCTDGGVSCPAISALLRMEIQPVEVPADASAEVAAFIHATNRVIEDGNRFSQHSQLGAAVEVKKEDLRLMAASLGAAATAFDRLGLSLDLSQDGISEFQEGIQTSGLPEIEQSFWENGGLTPSEVDAVAELLATTEVELSVPSVSMSRILHEGAEALARTK